jgi:hypothetical protein
VALACVDNNPSNLALIINVHENAEQGNWMCGGVSGEGITTRSKDLHG